MTLDTSWFQLNAWLIVILAIVLVIFLIFVVIWTVQAHQRKVSAGKEDLIGKTAVVDTALGPKGIVLVEGELWTAILDSGAAAPGQEVTVTGVEGLKLRVTKKK